MPTIDAATYRKDTTHPPRWGYQSRGQVLPSSIVIHTTNNRRATQFDTEAIYLRESAAVSAHFLIGKAGQIVQFLDVVKWQAWHAGECLPAFSNPRSIGIEHHVSIGEAWTPEQHTACTWLVQNLMRDHRIPAGMVETHRAVARPKGRKSDPEGWDDQAFYAWRATLAPAPLPDYMHVRGVPIYQREDRTGTVAGYLTPKDTVEVGKRYADGGVWLADGRGFIDGNSLEPV